MPGIKPAENLSQCQLRRKEKKKQPVTVFSWTRFSVPWHHKYRLPPIYDPCTVACIERPSFDSLDTCEDKRLELNAQIIVQSKPVATGGEAFGAVPPKNLCASQIFLYLPKFFVIFIKHMKTNLVP